MNEVREIRRELRRIRVTVSSPDGLVHVTVGTHGEVRDLRLDPRISRGSSGADLAARVMRAATDARLRAGAEAGDLVRPLTGRRRGEPVDVLFDPALSEIDRELARPPLPPPLDGRPVPAEHDLPALRRDLLRARARLAETRATAESHDGLITATVGGRGELAGLRVDDRVFRRSDAKWLAGAIVATVAEARAKVGR